MKATNDITLRPAARLAQVSEYYFSRKIKEIARLNEAGEDIISLAIGSPDMPPSPQTIDTLCREVRQPSAHGYQPTAGILPLKQAMASWYRRWFQVELNPSSEIQPLIGSKEGILHVTLAFCNPGDKVLVPNPGYPTYTSLSRILGCEVVCYDLLEDHGWQPDFATLESMDMTGVKIMWVNYPNMPTGAPASKEVYQRIVNLARNKGILVVNDNPYSFILSHQHLSILQIPGSKDCCLEFNSMSKSHNMPGWRVGLVAGRSDYISWILKVKSNIDSGMFRPLQLAAAEAYSNDEAWHEEANIQVYARRRQIAGRIMEALGCRYDPSQVGMFLWGRIPDCYAQVEDLTEWVLHKARVFITPGFIFGSNGKRFLRISLCAGEEKMEEALQRIQQALSKDNSHYQQ